MRHPLGAVLAGVLVAASPAGAQGLPPYAAVNPVVESRSGLWSQPYLEPQSRWRVALLFDYANSAELNDPPGPGYFVLDGEFLRLDLHASRDLGDRTFILGTIGFHGAYHGFMDGFLNWYHDVIGIDVPARSERRPENRYSYQIRLADGTAIDYESHGAALGDMRVGLGHRHTRHWQTVVAVTLPTATAPDGFGRGTVSGNIVTTVHVPLVEGVWTYEGTLGLGYTPAHGALADVQRTTFMSVSSGLRVRAIGRQVLFANVFFQSPQNRGTGLPSLDGRELTIDFGALIRVGKGPEFQVGMTQDLSPAGPALDLSFRLGVRW